MKVITTPIKDLVIIEPTIFKDPRGYFFEAYNEAKFKENGITTKFVQDNQSKSSFGVIRGLHYQLNPYAQIKLVRVLEGTIFDVAVDIRKGSPTFGNWFGIELSSENNKQLFIPQGFAHGFSVMSETAIVLYKCDSLYAPGNEGGIIYNDPQLNIDWKIEYSKELISAKDLKQPSIEKANYNFNY